MLRLDCEAKDYDWGRPVATSEVAQLARAAGKELDAARPWAELWMGTHPSGPSRVKRTGALLSDWLARHPEALGDRVARRFGGGLPFLFKVLSVETALSIQAHPDKPLAAKLHAERPHAYRDANHKPEMALAIEDFGALCGFVPLGELARALRDYPELAGVVGEDLCAPVLAGPPEDGEAARAALRGAFTALMTADAGAARGAVERLAARLGRVRDREPWRFGLKDSLVLRLHAQYPGDVGVLAAFFLNYVRLAAGEALYLPANEPHAYVWGQIVECMATSDNVVRAGLTPKLRDTDVLCEMLTYATGPPPVLTRGAGDVSVYAPPFDEFQVAAAEAGPGGSVALPESAGASLLLVLRGGATATVAGGPAAADALEGAGGEPLDVRRGDVFLVPAGAAVTLGAHGDGVVAYLASVNDRAL